MGAQPTHSVRAYSAPSRRLSTRLICRVSPGHSSGLQLAYAIVSDNAMTQIELFLSGSYWASLAQMLALIHHGVVFFCLVSHFLVARNHMGPQTCLTRANDCHSECAKTHPFHSN